MALFWRRITVASSCQWTCRSGSVLCLADSDPWIHRTCKGSGWLTAPGRSGVGGAVRVLGVGGAGRLGHVVGGEGVALAVQEVVAVGDDRQRRAARLGE